MAASTRFLWHTPRVEITRSSFRGCSGFICQLIVSKATIYWLLTGICIIKHGLPGLFWWRCLLLLRIYWLNVSINYKLCHLTFRILSLVVSNCCSWVFNQSLWTYYDHCGLALLYRRDSNEFIDTHSFQQWRAFHPKGRRYCRGAASLYGIITISKSGVVVDWLSAEFWERDWLFTCSACLEGTPTDHQFLHQFWFISPLSALPTGLKCYFFLSADVGLTACIFYSVSFWFTLFGWWQGRNGSSGGLFWPDKASRPLALCIDDPLRPGANIGAGSFNMFHVQVRPAVVLHCGMQFRIELLVFNISVKKAVSWVNNSCFGYQYTSFQNSPIGGSDS